MAYTRYAVNRLLHHDGVKLNQPTALYILSNDGLHVLENYTRDPAAIDTALRSHGAALPWRLQHNFYLGLERINISMAALQQVAIASTGTPGHKNIVWISPGLPVFSRVELTTDGQQQLFDSIRHLSDQLLKARISIYSVDPRGIQGAFIPASPNVTNNFLYAEYLNGLTEVNDAAFGNVAIQTLATQTGGHAFFGRNDVDREIAASLTDGDTYYTLAYSPSDKNLPRRIPQDQDQRHRPTGPESTNPRRLLRHAGQPGGRSKTRIPGTGRLVAHSDPVQRHIYPRQLHPTCESASTAPHRTFRRSQYISQLDIRREGPA